MSAAERRKRILQILELNENPVPATKLAEELGVSRQIVVGDVAMLRAVGQPIEATSRGYMVRKPVYPFSGRFRCKFGENLDQLRVQAYAVIDNGGLLESIETSDPQLGKLNVKVNLSSRYEADRFIEHAAELHITASGPQQCGIAVVRCRDDATMDRIRTALKQQCCAEELAEG